MRRKLLLLLFLLIGCRQKNLEFPHCSEFGFEFRNSNFGFEISYLLEAKEALDAASRIIKAFFGDVNDDEAFKGCSSDTLEAADMDRS